jgi:apolipoprotein N-acyltransferase
MITSGEPPISSAGAYPVYDTPLGKLATMICFDADFTDVSRQYGRQGVQLIANPSLFGSPLAELTYTQIVFVLLKPYRHCDGGCRPTPQLLILRTSYKTIYTPMGNKPLLLPIFHTGTGNTFYSRFGDWVIG